MTYEEMLCVSVRHDFVKRVSKTSCYNDVCVMLVDK